jgi:hypothetical protein
MTQRDAVLMAWALSLMGGLLLNGEPTTFAKAFGILAFIAAGFCLGRRPMLPNARPDAGSEETR